MGEIDQWLILSLAVISLLIRFRHVIFAYVVVRLGKDRFDEIEIRTAEGTVHFRADIKRDSNAVAPDEAPKLVESPSEVKPEIPPIAPTKKANQRPKRHKGGAR